VVARVVNPSNLPDANLFIPGLKPPVRDFGPGDDGDPAEVDTFIEMIRALRNQGPPAHADRG
jgi:hypothetical protein